MGTRLVPAAIGIAALAALSYLIFQPPSADLAAQTFRSDLWAAHGWVLWNDAWYGGHLIPGYSLLYPPLADLLGVRVPGALGAVMAAGGFAALAEDSYGPRARLGAMWFAVATATMLYTGRLTFALGVGFGVLALLAVARGRPGLAAVLGGLATATSPVAGLFAGLAAGAWFLCGHRRVSLGLLVGVGVTMALMVGAFPTEGYHPLGFDDYVKIPLLALAMFALIGRDQRPLLIGAFLYLLVGTLAVLIHTPLGGTVLRLGALAGGPVLALALWQRRNLGLAVMAIPLLVWQLSDPIDDTIDALRDPSTEAAFYPELITELERATAGEIAVVEVVPTRNRWESVYVGERFHLARGWLRQLESDDFDLFRGDSLDAAAYRGWLDDHAVSYVALNRRSEPVYTSESDLLDDPPPYLREVRSSRDWLLWRVLNPTPIVSPGARLTELGPDRFEVDPRRSGIYRIRLRWSPYFEVASGNGCVRERSGWTELEAADGRPLVVEARLSLAGALRSSESC